MEKLALLKVFKPMMKKYANNTDKIKGIFLERKWFGKGKYLILTENNLVLWKSDRYLDDPPVMVHKYCLKDIKLRKVKGFQIGLVVEYKNTSLKLKITNGDDFIDTFQSIKEEKKKSKELAKQRLMKVCRNGRQRAC